MFAIIIPTYNERINIKVLIHKLFTLFPHVQIVVVDDNSPDGTGDQVAELQKKYRTLDLIIRTIDKGRGGACLTGFRHILKNYNKVKYVVEMDADLSHDPGDIQELLSKRGLHRVVIGSRYVTGSKIVDWPLYRLILSKLTNGYIRFVLGIPITDYTMGFRCYSREALKIITGAHIKYKGFVTLSETAYLLYKRGISFVEVPITLKDRSQGKSNITFKEVLLSLWAIIIIRLHSD